MAEEETNTSNINTDDLNALRILLHNVKGISAVSSPIEVISPRQDD